MSELQALLAETDAGAAAKQTVGWDFESWRATLKQARLSEITLPALEDIEDRWAADGGITRAAVRDVGRTDAVRLLVASMAWGFGSIPYGPSRTAKMLNTLDAATALAEIVEKAHDGADIAFSSLFSWEGKSRVKNLSIAMGSKVLYFAAGGLDSTDDDPLVYDTNVYHALRNLDGGWADAPDPGKRVSSDLYASYVRRIDGYARDSGLSRSDVEVALFEASPWLRRRRRIEARGLKKSTLGGPSAFA